LLAGRDRFVSSYSRTSKASDPSAVASQGQTEVGEQCVQGQEEKQDSQRYVQKMGGTNMIEQMKQWLEALEDFVDVIKYDNEQDDIGRRACCDVLSYNPHREDCKAKQAITAIKEAIAELESQEPVERDWRKAPWGFGEKRLSTVEYSDIVSDGGLDPRNKFDTPPQRTWVGLTDEDKDTADLVEAGVEQDWIDGYLCGLKDAEANLKEKNNA
jgi:hypothetical protein